MIWYTEYSGYSAEFSAISEMLIPLTLTVCSAGSEVFEALGACAGVAAVCVSRDMPPEDPLAAPPGTCCAVVVAGAPLSAAGDLANGRSPGGSNNSV